MRACKGGIVLAAALSVATILPPSDTAASFSRRPLIDYPLKYPIRHQETLRQTDLSSARRTFASALMVHRRKTGDLALIALRMNDRKRFTAMVDMSVRHDINNGKDRETIEFNMNSLLSSSHQFTPSEMESVVVGIAMGNIARFRRIAKTRDGKGYVSRTFLELSVASQRKRDFLMEFKRWILSDGDADTLAIRLTSAMKR